MNMYIGDIRIFVVYKTHSVVMYRNITVTVMLQFEHKNVQNSHKNIMTFKRILNHYLALNRSKERK